MKIKELIRSKVLTTSVISKVKTYSEELSIPIEKYKDIIGTNNVLFKKMLGFYNLQKIINVFTEVEIITIYTTIGEVSELMMLKGTRSGLTYVIAGIIQVDRKSEGKENLTNKLAYSLKNLREFPV